MNINRYANNVIKNLKIKAIKLILYQGDQTFGLKRHCPVFDYVPLSRKMSNGTLFIPYLEYSPVLIPVFTYYVIFVKKINDV